MDVLLSMAKPDAFVRQLSLHNIQPWHLEATALLFNRTQVLFKLVMDFGAILILLTLQVCRWLELQCPDSFHSHFRHFEVESGSLQVSHVCSMPEDVTEGITMQRKLQKVRDARNMKHLLWEAVGTE